MRSRRQDYKYPSLESYFALSNESSSGAECFDDLLKYIEECRLSIDDFVETSVTKIHAVLTLELNKLVLSTHLSRSSLVMTLRMPIQTSIFTAYHTLRSLSIFKSPPLDLKPWLSKD